METTIDFFANKDFTSFKSSLDAEMKRLQSQGLGSKKRQAEELTCEDEEKLWETGLLGDRTPHTLLDTMVFCNGLYFALRSGREHRQLRLRPCQIEIIQHENEQPYLKYTEDVSKNRPGGLKGRNVKPKIVYHHANVTNPDRCFVRLFKKYVSMCPDTPAELNAFYLMPSTKPTKSCWYTLKPLGHNTLTKTISRLCQAAGISGFKTNHSLRATAATRLYQHGVDEQLVMERTGHRSLEGVRNYKRTSNEQREALSDILNNKVPRIDNTLTVAKVQNQLQVQDEESSSTSLGREKQLTSSQITTTSNTNNIQTKNSLPGSFIFNSCPSVTLNIHYH